MDAAEWSSCTMLNELSYPVPQRCHDRAFHPGVCAPCLTALVVMTRFWPSLPSGSGPSAVPHLSNATMPKLRVASARLTGLTPSGQPAAGYLVPRFRWSEGCRLISWRTRVRLRASCTGSLFGRHQPSGLAPLSQTDIPCSTPTLMQLRPALGPRQSRHASHDSGMTILPRGQQHSGPCWNDMVFRGSMTRLLSARYLRFVPFSRTTTQDSLLVNMLVLPSGVWTTGCGMSCFPPQHPHRWLRRLCCGLPQLRDCARRDAVPHSAAIQTRLLKRQQNQRYLFRWNFAC